MQAQRSDIQIFDSDSFQSTKRQPEVDFQTASISAYNPDCSSNNGPHRMCMAKLGESRSLQVYPKPTFAFEGGSSPGRREVSRFLTPGLSNGWVLRS